MVSLTHCTVRLLAEEANEDHGYFQEMHFQLTLSDELFHSRSQLILIDCFDENLQNCEYLLLLTRQLSRHLGGC